MSYWLILSQERRITREFIDCHATPNHLGNLVAPANGDVTFVVNTLGSVVIHVLPVSSQILTLAQRSHLNIIELNTGRMPPVATCSEGVHVMYDNGRVSTSNKIPYKAKQPCKKGHLGK